jgi:hypothetical protein
VKDADFGNPIFFRYFDSGISHHYPINPVFNQSGFFNMQFVCNVLNTNDLFSFEIETTFVRPRFNLYQLMFRFSEEGCPKSGRHRWSSASWPALRFMQGYLDEASNRYWLIGRRSATVGKS